MQEVCTEVNTIIKYMPKEYQNKIPSNVLEFFEKQKLNNYKIDIDSNNIFDNSKLKEETLAIIAMLNLKYWCPNERIKKQLLKQYNENEKRYQKEIAEKYNVDNIFKNKQEEKQQLYEEANNMQLVEYKESFIKKIINKIKRFFRR